MSKTQQPVGRLADAAACRDRFWLIAKRRRGRLEVFTTRSGDGRRVLPVFSFEEEAALFLRLGVWSGWRVRRTETGELVSLLYGLCRQVELVALDPVSDCGTEMMNRLVSLERTRFVNVFLGRKTTVRLPAGAPRLTRALDSRRSASA